MTADGRATFRIFAYGSNILSARLKGRCPSARPLGVARLPGHELRWHKRSTDGSGKCDVVSVDSGSAVFGVVYEIDEIDKAALDRAEGLRSGYDEKNIAVIMKGTKVSVSIYFATRTDPTRKPYTWYKALVVAGAIEHGLPASYIASLEATEALEDPDRTRHGRNMRIINAVAQMDGPEA